MYFSDEIVLRTVTQKLVDGLYVPANPLCTTVFADKKSVKRAEFYSAQTAGMRVDVAFVLHRDDYAGQTELLYGKDCYDVIRAYDTDGDTVELTCTRRTP